MHIPQALSLDQNNVTLCLTEKIKINKIKNKKKKQNKKKKEKEKNQKDPGEGAPGEPLRESLEFIFQGKVWSAD